MARILCGGKITDSAWLKKIRRRSFANKATQIVGGHARFMAAARKARVYTNMIN